MEIIFYFKNITVIATSYYSCIMLELCETEHVTHVLAVIDIVIVDAVA